MNEYEKAWYEHLPELLKNLHADNINVQAPGSINYMGGQHAHLHQASATTAQPNENRQSAEPSTEDEEILDRLAPIFFGIRAEADSFLRRIRGMKPTDITQLVTRLVKERKISDKSYRRDLWTVLHDHGLYTRSEANWNSQIIPKKPQKN